MNESRAFAAAVPAVAAEAVRCQLLGHRFDLAAMTARLSEGDPALAAALRRDGASFVTLKRHDRLRGCIGSLIAQWPLASDIAANARKAMRDPRMAPVEAVEWPQLSISVSVLTPPKPLPVADRAHLEAALRPGVDGLTLRGRDRRATFLPSVWESLSEPGEFVSALLRKGGWDPPGWPADVTVETYGSDHYTSPPPRPPLEEP